MKKPPSKPVRASKASRKSPARSSRTRSTNPATIKLKEKVWTELESYISHLQGPDLSPSLPPGVIASPRRTFPAQPIPCAAPHYLMSPQFANRPNEGYRIQDLHGDVWVDDRFQWWHKQPPASGPITTSEFECVFLPGLATVVGSEVEGFADQGYRVVPWDHLNWRIQPQFVPGITFAPYGIYPQTYASFRHVRAQGAFGNREELRVLENTRRGRRKEDPRLPPLPEYPLFLEFLMPQRAVGLEYGILLPPDDQDEPLRTDIELRAYDINGNLLPASVSDGRQTTMRTRLERNIVTHRIGVIDRGGQIAKVELRFKPPIRHRQIVYRVWHEPLPLAAVYQGEIEFRSQGAPPSPSNPAYLTLPPWCDRAVPVVRGFKLSYADGQPHETKNPQARLTGDTYYRGPKGGTMQITPEAGLYAPNSGSPATIGKIYFSVLAWDSQQAEVFVGDASREHITQDAASNVVMQLPDPCPIPTGQRLYLSSTEALERICGPLAGLLRGWRFQYHQDTAYEQIEFFVGTRFRNTLTRSGSFGEHILWSVPYVLQGLPRNGDLYDHASWMEGAVLTGRSIVTTSSEPAAIALPNRGPRPNSDYFYPNWEEVRQFPLTPQFEVEVACVGLEWFHIETGEEPLRELEVEVKGVRYDGLTVDWQMASGASVNASGEVQDLLPVYGWPLFVGISSNRNYKTPHATTRSLHVAETVVGLSLAADEPGYIRNIGSSALVLGGMRLGNSPEDQEFRWYFYWNNQRMNLAQLAGGTPFVIRPGQTLWVMTEFVPTTVVSPSTIAFLHILTNDPQNPEIVLTSSGRAIPSAPVGRWAQPLLDFGNVRVGTAQTRVATLLSTGTTPLVLRTVRFSPMAVAVTHRIPPGGLIEDDVKTFLITYSPTDLQQALDPNQAVFIAETNAGELSLPLIGTVIP